MENSIVVRKALHSEIEYIISLGQMLQNESKDYEPLLTFDKNSAISRYRQELINDNALIIVAIINKEIVGYQYSFIHKLDYLMSNNLECVYEAIFVLPKWRSQGIARKLISFSENWAINDMHADRISAYIYSNNIASEMLHKSLGFEPYNIEYVKKINKQ